MSHASALATTPVEGRVVVPSRRERRHEAGDQ